MRSRRIESLNPSAGALDRLRQALAEAALPATIYAQGNPALLERPMIAFAGSRRAEGWALAALESLAGSIAATGAVVVSGGAIGSDVAAHRGALQVGGSTVIVLPCSLEEASLKTWRPEMKELWDDKRCLFLSPFGPRAAISRSSPIVRNRLIAALGEAAVAGQTGTRGGTNHCLGVARQLGRPIFHLAWKTSDAELRLAWRELKRLGARSFTHAEALDRALPREILAAASRATSERARTAGLQGSLFETGNAE